MLMDAVSWWLRQIGDLFSGGRSKWPSWWRRALVIEYQGELNMVTLTRRHGRGDSLIGSYRLDEPGLTNLQHVLRCKNTSKAVVLLLQEELLLERTVKLPLLAERELKRVLEYEMDRLSPFAAEEVFYAWEIEQRDCIGGQIHLRLSLVPRVRLQSVLGSLTSVGLVATKLEVQSTDGDLRRITLQHTSTNGSLRQIFLIASLSIMLALTATIQPFVLQTIALSRVNASLAHLQPQLALLEALKQRVAVLTADTAVISRELDRAGDALTMLAEITEILPDDTFLTGLRMSQRSLLLDGSAGSAARLISALAADLTLSNPVFVAPVVRSASGSTEQFSIHVELGR